MAHASESRNIVKNIFAGFGLIVFCLLVLFILFLTWKMPFHAYQLWAMQRRFRSDMHSIHPAESQLRAEMAEFGNFGNSNHCDYFVGEFRSSPLSKKEILKRYAAIATSSFVGNRLLETGVYFIDEDIFTDHPWSQWLEKYLPAHRHVMNQNTYLIFSEDEGNSPVGDIRCH